MNTMVLLKSFMELFDRVAVFHRKWLKKFHVSRLRDVLALQIGVEIGMSHTGSSCQRATAHWPTVT